MVEKDFRGMVQVYAGDGKGKTTAALGLAVRASGQGMKVIIIQFLKGERGGEHFFLDKYKDFEIVQFSKGDIFARPEDQLRKEAVQTLEFAAKTIVEGKYDMVVLDEIFIAHWRGFITLKQILELIEKKPANVELIMTGRKVPGEVIKVADLVTEMLMIKHPFTEGVGQRRGIEF